MPSPLGGWRAHATIAAGCESRAPLAAPGGAHDWSHHRRGRPSRFDRHFWDGTFHFTRIGKGSLGGKAGGLVGIKDLLSEKVERAAFPGFSIEVPTMAVIATGFFDEFMTRNRLWDLAFEEMADNHIAHAFQQAELPVELLGDLRALIEQVKTPLAIRSSSLLEDALERPFAGVYTTKMIPNNQFDPDTRFRKLLEAIKLVYASTYFGKARDYIATTGHNPREEKMAVIIQEVVGCQARRALLSGHLRCGALGEFLSQLAGAPRRWCRQSGSRPGQDHRGGRHRLDVLPHLSQAASALYFTRGDAAQHAN